MFKPVEVFVGLRYVRAKRRDHFISFISFISIAGVALGVAALITVLSVMNGFEKELTQRILGMASHATISSGDTPLEDWETLASDIETHPDIVGVAPYLYAEGMLSNAKYVNGTVIRGVLPEVERKVSIVAERMVAGQFSSLASGEFNLLLGQELARALRVEVGDKVILVMPQTNITPAGILPRHKRFSVSGIFEIGMHEFDSALALIHLDDAMRLFRKSAPTGLRLKTTDIFAAPILSRQIAAQLPGYFWVRDWTQQYSNFFRALKTEKTVMFVILTLIVAVAAFNIISTLFMTVLDKQADIAVLRTLGASPRSILIIFMTQGVLIGLVGIVCGAIGGVWLALNVEGIVASIENLFQVKFLAADIYYISELPSDMRWHDVIVICTVAFIFCILATIYPALRAAHTRPAEALRYE